MTTIETGIETQEYSRKTIVEATNDAAHMWPAIPEQLIARPIRAVIGAAVAIYEVTILHRSVD